MSTYSFTNCALAETGVLKGERTDMSGWRAGVMSCCRIHEAVVCGIDGAEGCCGDEPGTHPSIAVLYKKELKELKCFAETGVLVRDKQFARAVVQLPRSGAYMQEESLGCMRKYIRGMAVEVSSFGAGYCYLRAVRPEVRMRVARVLGPISLVADVLRMINAVGISSGRSMEWKFIAPGYFHLQYSDVPRDPLLAGLEVYHEGILLLRKHGSSIRVGGDDLVCPVCNRVFHHPPTYARHTARHGKVMDSGGVYVGDPIGGQREIISKCMDGDERSVGFLMANMSILDRSPKSVEFNSGLTRVAGIVAEMDESDSLAGSVACKHVGKVEGHVIRSVGYTAIPINGSLKFIRSGLGVERRAKGLHQWFRLAGISFSLDGDLMDALLLATAAPAVYANSKSGLRDIVRMWELVGDVAIKWQQSVFCAAYGLTVKDYSDLDKLASNLNLAMILESCGLRDHCDVVGLDSKSLANGNIVEAVIGLLSLYGSQVVQMGLVEQLGLIPMDVVDRGKPDILCVAVESPKGLSSRQYERALQMVAEGLL